MRRPPGIHTSSTQHPKTRIFGLLIFLLVFNLSFLSGQAIRVEAQNQPLSEVLLKLAREEGIQLSFDDALLSEEVVTMRKSFQSHEDAIDGLLKGRPLSYIREGEVFIIVPREQPQEPTFSRIAGKVMDRSSREPLPYSHIAINGFGLVADQGGNFSWLTGEDSLFHVRVSYLGYFILDTMLTPGSRHIMALQSSYIGLQEVVVEGQQLERSGQVGETAGQIRLNHKIAYRLPGNGDNAIFNFLRLQPGILAAGEQSSEMIIWGSYAGHSQLLFDGFTIYGLKNFNDNISFVNPYMSKDIMVLKGGYGADYGDRVGGIVEVTGIRGNTQKPSINLNINNMTVNGMAGIPIGERSVLTLAYRHTYYNLADADDLSIKLKGNKGGQQADISVYPDYVFRDFNIKYAGSTRSGDNYFLSLYEGKDHYSYELDQERNQVRVLQEALEENRQRGGSLFYGKVWRNGNTSHFNLSASGLNNKQHENLDISRRQDGSVIRNQEVNFLNSIVETRFQNKNQIHVSERHTLKFGLNYTYSHLIFEADSSSTYSFDSRAIGHRFTGFVQDSWSILPGIDITPGIRIDYPVNLSMVYIQPRIAARFDPVPGWRINAAWGIYNQFISETSIIDELGNYRYFWALCNNAEIPVLEATHLVGGLTFNRNGLTIGVESFYKTTRGITRYVSLPRGNFNDVHQGDARVYGMDLLVKKYLKKHEMWASYTLSKTEEHFPYFRETDYRDAPQDQRHEVKGALLLNFSPFYFSANYVYGSGFPDRQPLPESSVSRHPYSRLDVSFIYRHTVKKYHFEAGISILNLLNTENIKYSNLIRVPYEQSTSITILAEAVPFTPTIYLNLSF